MKKTKKEGRGRKPLYPWGSLKVGETFQVKVPKKDNVRTKQSSLSSMAVQWNTVRGLKERSKRVFTTERIKHTQIIIIKRIK